jgi:hypothetical protein
MARSRFLSKPAVGFAAVGFSLAIVVGTAPAALANSFGESYPEVAFGYADDQDSFCVTPKKRKDALLMLAPFEAGQGPSYDERIPAGGGERCFSLARAYEDSGYSYSVRAGGPYYDDTFYS